MKSLLVFLILMFTLPLIAQNKKVLSINGTDPTESRTRIDIYIAEARFTASGDIFATKLTGDYAFANWGSIGLGIPYVYADMPSSTTFGLGDVDINFLFSLHDKNNDKLFQAVALGMDVSLSSGDATLGTGLGQNLASPYITAAFLPADEILVAPILQEYYSFGGEDDARKIHELSIRIKNVFTLEKGHWLTLTPEVIIDFEGLYRPTYNIRSSLGYMVDENWALSGDFITHLIGDPRFSSIGRFNARYLF